MTAIVLILFCICIGFLRLIADIFGWTYQETSVYVNLYFQYGIILLSGLSILVVSIRKLSISNILLSIAYNFLTLFVGSMLYTRYGVIETEKAYNLCKNDLIKVSEYIPIYCQHQEMARYCLLNLLIFVVGFLLILFLNRIWRKSIK